MTEPAAKCPMCGGGEVRRFNSFGELESVDQCHVSGREQHLTALYATDLGRQAAELGQEPVSDCFHYMRGYHSYKPMLIHLDY